MTRPLSVSIDPAAFKHNLKRVRHFAPHSKILSVMKANAYGHGIQNFLSCLDEADGIGVRCLEEALLLRESGVTLPIVLMEGFFSKDELLVCAKHQLTCVIHQQAQLEILLNYSLPTPISVWLKLDTGMHRLGFSPEDYSQTYRTLIQSKNVLGFPVLMSHFACADEVNNTFTQDQLSCFQKSIQGLTGKISLANSAGVLARPQSHYDWVRPGIMLYGISPFANRPGDDFGLLPVMTLSSALIAVRKIKKGESVGYGAAWTSARDSIIGTVAIGYSDGYPRHAKNGTPVLVNQREVTLVGHVSMDMLTVDLTDYPEVRIDDPVILWGKGLPVERVAQWADTIPYELVAGMT